MLYTQLVELDETHRQMNHTQVCVTNTERHFQCVNTVYIVPLAFLEAESTESRLQYVLYYFQNLGHISSTQQPWEQLEAIMAHRSTQYECLQPLSMLHLDMQCFLMRFLWCTPTFGSFIVFHRGPDKIISIYNPPMFCHLFFYTSYYQEIFIRVGKTTE